MTQARRVVSIDTETELLKPGDMVPRLVSFAWADVDHPRAVLLHHSECLSTFRNLLLDPNVHIVGQFTAFDMAVMMRHSPGLTWHIFKAYDDGRIGDTKVREQLLSIRDGTFPMHPGFSLADIVKRRLGLDLAKGEDTWRLCYGELRDTHVDDWPEAARTYALLDAETTLAVWQSQEQEAPIADEANQARASFWLHLCAARGLWVDAEKRAEYLTRLGDEERHLIAVLQDIGFVRRCQCKKACGKSCKAGTRDTKAVMALMLALGAKARTPKGAVKIDSEACNDSGHPDLIKYGRLGEVRSALKNHGKLIATNPVHTRYDLAVTGRTTSAPNVQNLPRSGGLRECFIPRPGFVFAGADYDQLELRTWAQVCVSKFGRSALAEALNAGLDPHTELSKETGAERQANKGLNFGLPGGMGITRLVAHLKSYGVIVTPHRAGQLKAAWQKRWPEQAPYFQMCDTPGALVHLFSERVRGGHIPYTEYCNAWFQGLGSDAAKRAGWLVTRACYAEPMSPLYGSYPVLFAHDEFLLEVPKLIAHEAALELARLMVAGANEFLPDVPAKTKPCLSRCYSKSAKPVLDSDGRLIPC